MKKIILILCIAFLFSHELFSQTKTYKLTPKGDTINRIDANGAKQGPWVVHVDPLREEKGYEEEGYFVNGQKDGPWRRYNLTGDFIALENFKLGEKDGKSEYFTNYGNPLREESWHAYDPAHPYDTIPVYGETGNQIVEYKIVKAEPHSIKDGTWTWYDPQTGQVVRAEQYERGVLLRKNQPFFGGATTGTSSDLSDSDKTPDGQAKVDQKPKEVLEFEKKNRKKKSVKVIDGKTGY